ncbi:MAG: cupin domain-containing protein [Usitatibacter sp.]
MRNRSSIVAACLGAALAAPAFAADAASSPIYMNPSEVKWGAAPPVFPKGAKMAVLEGDPGKAGVFVARLMMPANYRIAPHWHSQDEDLTVISGTFYLAEGDTLDTKHAHEVKAGGFHHLPAKTHHFAFSKGPAIVQINGMGPFDITYIDPKDDPSKAAAAAPAKK